MPVTQKDIASKLGVTRVLVSRALAGHPTVAQRTQVLVRETAHEMGYHEGSNAGARALAARRNGREVRHGVLAYAMGMPDERQQVPYWSLLQQGVEEAAREAGYRIVLTADAAQWEAVDGLIFHGDPPVAPLVPHVGLMVSSKSALSVSADDAGGARVLTTHLLAAGHRSIACLMDEGSAQAVVERVRGWKQELRKAGITPDKRWQRTLTLDGGDFVGRGRKNMRAWLREDWQSLGCTALLVQNDHSAIGAMQELLAAGIRVPQDVSVVGFDGAGEGELCTPRLTTIEVPLRLAGRRAVQLLLRRIDGEEPASEVLPTQLCIRESSGPPPQVRATRPAAKPRSDKTRPGRKK